MIRSTLRIVRFIIMAITGVCGTFLNCLIIVLNFSSWRDVTTSGSYNKILFVIGLVNIIFQEIQICDCFFETFDVYFLHQDLFLVMFTLELFLIGVNIWNTTWLSMFCFFRLVSSSHGWFLKIRDKFLTCLPHIIVGSILVSAAINLPLFWMTTLETTQNVTEKPNMSGQRISINYHYSIFSSLLGFSIPFSMTGVSIGLSLITLSRHIWRVGSGDSHLTSAQLQGHYRAVRTLVIRVVIDIVFTLITATGISFPLVLNSLIYCIFWIMVLMYPTSQAFILIFGNPKLKRGFYGFMEAKRQKLRVECIMCV